MCHHKWIKLVTFLDLYMFSNLVNLFGSWQLPNRSQVIFWSLMFISLIRTYITPLKLYSFVSTLFCISSVFSQLDFMVVSVCKYLCNTFHSKKEFLPIVFTKYSYCNVQNWVTLIKWNIENTKIIIMKLTHQTDKVKVCL